MRGSNKFSQKGEQCEETKGSNFKFQNGGGGSFPKSPPIVPQMETEYNFPLQGKNCFFPSMNSNQQIWHIFLRNRKLFLYMFGAYCSAEKRNM